MSETEDEIREVVRQGLDDFERIAKKVRTAKIQRHDLTVHLRSGSDIVCEDVTEETLGEFIDTYNMTDKQRFFADKGPDLILEWSRYLGHGNGVALGRSTFHVSEVIGFSVELRTGRP